MAMIKGSTVKLYIKSQTGVDDFGVPTYSETSVNIDNVLIEPVSNDAIISELQLTGKKLTYVLHIPKGDTHIWVDTKVEFYGKVWRTYGDCLFYEKSPLSWDKKIKVEHYD